jgi:hypothetical protein
MPTGNCRRSRLPSAEVPGRVIAWPQVPGCHADRRSSEPVRSDVGCVRLVPSTVSAAHHQSNGNTQPVDLWRDETPSGRLTRVGLASTAVAVLFAVQGLLELGTPAVAIPIFVAAGCSGLAAAVLLLTQHRLRGVSAPHPPTRLRRIEPSRYLRPRNGRPVTVEDLRRVRARHLIVGSSCVTVVLMIAAASTAASGAPDGIAIAVLAAVFFVLVLPMFVVLSVDRVRLDRAITQLLNGPASD